MADQGTPPQSASLSIKYPGIRCPRCGCADWRDESGRPWDITHTVNLCGHVRRYRVCRYCGQRVRTREAIELKGDA